MGGITGAFIVLSTGWSVLGRTWSYLARSESHSRAVFIVNTFVFHFVADRTSSYERRILAVQAPVQLIAQVVAWLALYQLGKWAAHVATYWWRQLGTWSRLARGLGYLVPHTRMK